MNSAVFFIKSFGRLPVLFWSQFIGLGFAIGCAVAPDLKVSGTLLLQIGSSTNPGLGNVAAIPDICRHEDIGCDIPDRSSGLRFVHRMRYVPFPPARSVNSFIS